MSRPISLRALLVVIVVYCFCSTGGSGGVNSGRLKNLVVFELQNVGWGDMGAYVGWQQETPHLDSLARSADSTILYGLYSETSKSASQAAFLTGRLPASWGFYSSNDAERTELHEDSSFVLPSTLPTLAKQLSSHSSKLIGRWYLGQRPEANPLNSGFSSFLGYVSDRSYEHDDLRYPNPGIYRDKHIFSRFYETYSGELMNKENRTSTLPSMFLREGCDFIEGATADRAGGTEGENGAPFYLHLTIDALSHPCYRSKRYVNVSRDTRSTDFSDALIETDHLIGGIIDQLRIRGAYNNTVIAIFSGSTAEAALFNGGSNSPFSGSAGDTTEGGVRAPGIVVIPGRGKKEPYRSHQTLTLYDLHHTLASLVGAPSPHGGECTSPEGGVSVPKSELSGQGGQKEDCIFTGIDLSDKVLGRTDTGQWEHRVVPIYRGRTLMAIREGRYKIHRFALANFVPGQHLGPLTAFSLRNVTEFPMLFDVVTDPSERFYVGDGFGSSSERYTLTMPQMSATITRVLVAVDNSATGGLLNECDVIYREWSPPGCTQTGMCLPPPPSHLTMCTVPPYVG